MRNLLIDSTTRLKKCKESCNYFEFCRGGCNHCAMISGDIKKINGFDCFITKNMLKYIIRCIKSLNSLSSTNPTFAKILKNDDILKTIQTRLKENKVDEDGTKQKKSIN